MGLSPGQCITRFYTLSTQENGWFHQNWGFPVCRPDVYTAADIHALFGECLDFHAAHAVTAVGTNETGLDPQSPGSNQLGRQRPTAFQF